MVDSGIEDVEEAESTGGKDAEIENTAAEVDDDITTEELDGATDDELIEELVTKLDELDGTAELEVKLDDEVDGALEDEVLEDMTEELDGAIDEEVTGVGIGIHGAVSQTAQTDGLSELGGAAL